MILNKTINIPEEFFGFNFQDVHVKIVNESINFMEADPAGEIAYVRLLVNGSFLGEEYRIPLYAFEESEIEEYIIDCLKKIIDHKLYGKR